MDQCLNITKVTTQFFEELKTTVLQMKRAGTPCLMNRGFTKTKQNRNTYPFYESKSLPYSSQNAGRHCMPDKFALSPGHFKYYVLRLVLILW